MTGQQQQTATMTVETMAEAGSALRRKILALATVAALMSVMLVAGVASGAFAKGQPLYTCEWTIGGTHSIGNVIPKDKAYYERTFEAVCVRQ